MSLSLLYPADRAIRKRMYDFIVVQADQTIRTRLHDVIFVVYKRPNNT